MKRRMCTLMVIGVLWSLVSSAALAAAASSACESSKLGTSANYAACRLKAASKSVKTGNPADYSKCSLSKFDVAEAKAGSGVCPSESDQASVGDFLDACTESVVVALGGADLPLDVLTCNENLATCGEDLAATSADLATCGSGLETCTGSLATCTDAGITCVGDLTACNGSLGVCSTSLSTCGSDLSSTTVDLSDCNTMLDACSDNLSGCNAGLKRCNANLGNCGADLSTTNANLNVCSSSLGTCSETLASCHGDLTICSAGLSTCSGNLGTCAAGLDACGRDLASTNADLGDCQTSLGAANSGTATAGDVLAGRTFTSSSGLGGVGTMPNNGAVALTPGTSDQVIAAGYHDGAGKCLGDAELLSGNIRNGVSLFGVTGTLISGGLPTTGQTNCYDDAGNLIPCAGTGQDGAYQKGVVASYTDNGDGTITDNLTGLMWEKLSDDGTIHDYNLTYTWRAAVATKIATLNSSGFAGYGDWRLPNIRELETLKNFGAFNPATYTSFSSACAAGCTVAACSCTSYTNPYWSSTSAMTDKSYAWAVTFSLGWSHTNSRKTDRYYVRAVRSGD